MASVDCEWELEVASLTNQYRILELQMYDDLGNAAVIPVVPVEIAANEAYALLFC